MDGGLKIKLDTEEGENLMSKALKIQVLALEDHDEVKLIMSALNKIKDDTNYPTPARTKVRSILDELYKIDAIFENTNNN